jgi:hypothetical protein
VKFNATICKDLGYMDYAFNNVGQSGDGIKVTIGANVTRIPAYLFDASSNASINIISLQFAKDSKCSSIGTYAFENNSTLATIIIPVSVTSIDNYAFWSCSSNVKIYYGGTSNNWENISIGSYNNSKFTLEANRYYYSENTPGESGNYWHYDTDNVTPILW